MLASSATPATPKLSRQPVKARRGVACRCQPVPPKAAAPSFRVPLSGNTGVWITNVEAVQYDVYGPSFVIHRTVRVAPEADAGAPVREQFQMTYRPSFLPMPATPFLSLPPPAPAYTARSDCLGIVPVVSNTDTISEDSDNMEQDLSNIFETTSSTFSPRRTAKLKFTCNLCGATNIKPVNPSAFKDGTIFARCAKCEVAHKIVDNLNLFHDFKGPVFGSPSGLVVDDELINALPSLPPFYWENDGARDDAGYHNN